MLRIDGLNGNASLPFSPSSSNFSEFGSKGAQGRVNEQTCLPATLTGRANQNRTISNRSSFFNEPFDFLSEHKLVDVKSRNVNEHGVMVAGVEPCLIPQFTNQLGKDEIINGCCELRKSVLSIQFTRVF